MVQDGTTAIFVTFLLAIVGYAGLTAVVLLSLKGNMPLLLWRAAAVVILAHVGMVWIFRYQWQFHLAVRNGYAGFLLFHGALLLILISLLSQERIARGIVQVAFLVVTVGALGASFRYEAVAIYRLPVILGALAGGGGLLFHWIQGRRAAGETRPS